MARAAMYPPASAELLCTFANTLDLDVDAEPPDAIPDAEALTRWLRERDLIARDERATAVDHRLAIGLRSGLRDVMTLHNDQDRASAAPQLQAATGDLPLRLAFDGLRPVLTPALDGTRGGLGWLVVAIAEAQAAGVWTRLKLCVADDCRLAFYDTSKNCSRHWCSMGVCGNRQKTRNYRARQRTNQ